MRLVFIYKLKDSFNCFDLFLRTSMATVTIVFRFSDKAIKKIRNLSVSEFFCNSNKIKEYGIWEESKKKKRERDVFFFNLCLCELIILGKYFQIFLKGDKGLKGIREMAQECQVPKLSELRVLIVHLGDPPGSLSSFSYLTGQEGMWVLPCLGRH